MASTSNANELIIGDLKLQDYEHLLREFYYEQSDENNNNTGGVAQVKTEVPDLEEAETEKLHGAKQEKFKKDLPGSVIVKKELSFEGQAIGGSADTARYSTLEVRTVEAVKSSGKMTNGKQSEDSLYTQKETPKEYKSDIETTTSLHCARCNKTFASHLKYYYHKRRHTIIDSGRFKCDYCSKSLGSNNELIFHVNSKHQTIPPKNAPKSEINLQHKQVAMHCTVCKQRFLTRDELEVHYSTHSMNESLTYCARCDKKFLTVARFKTHKMRHRNVDLGRFVCTLCKKAFASKMEQVIHEQTGHKLETGRP